MCIRVLMYAGVLVLRSARACVRVHITGGGVVKGDDDTYHTYVVGNHLPHEDAYVSYAQVGVYVCMVLVGVRCWNSVQMEGRGTYVLQVCFFPQLPVIWCLGLVFSWGCAKVG